MKRTSLCLLMVFYTSTILKAQEENNGMVDYESFLDIGQELASYRESRLVTIETFTDLGHEENTIILDTRSKKAFDEIHVKGAVHLNFSDFTKASLEDVIGNKGKRILIYCNNNFDSPLRALTSKMRPLALNIPTFINLYGYGYKNIYELDAYLDTEDPRVALEGTLVNN